MNDQSFTLPSYYDSLDLKRSTQTAIVSVKNLKRFLKSPAMRRLILFLLFLPIPIFTFLMGKASSLPARKSIQLSSFDTFAKSSLTSFNNNSAYKTWAFGLKTGEDVALKRTPIQLMTFLSPVRDQVIMIGDAPGIYVADVKMIDVVSDQVSDESAYAPPPTKHNVATGGKQYTEELVPDENSKGWKSDAKKNIPGFKLLYEQFPDAEWYFMIDDDTYVFLENMKDALAKYNPLEPHYLGAIAQFTGCDGIQNLGTSPYFAHGGSGIVISRGALLKMLPLADSCIEKYHHCWAGDIRLGLCLRDAGVLVQNVGYFSPNSPNSNFNFSLPCATPRTFHHLLPEQIQKLFELEQVAKSQNQRVLLEDVFKAFLDDKARMDYDRPGGDFKHTKTTSADECKELCQATKKCVAYTFESGGCHLKDIAPPIKQRKTGAVTGLITEHFVCLE